MKCISRIDQPERKTHGWYVRINYFGDQIRKFFSDFAYGGKWKAHARAVAWRDKTLREHGLPVTDRVVVLRTRAKSTGIPGITIQSKSHISRITGEPGPAASYFVVTYKPAPNRNAVKLFRIPKDDDKRKSTLLKAVGYLRDREKEIYGAPIKAKYSRALRALV